MKLAQGCVTRFKGVNAVMASRLSTNTNPIVRTGRPVSTEQPSSSSAQEIDKRFLLGCESTNVSVERSNEDKDADENVDADQVGTGRPVGSEQSIDLFTQRIDIDFRVSGLPHAVVKHAENFRVRELVKKIESHPHRQALQADLQQNNAYNPFSGKSKKMIRDMGNVEFFELCETLPKVQCSAYLLYWNHGIVYCICGHLLRENESSRHLHQWRFCFCFGDDSHRRDARHSHPCEDRRDAETTD